MNLLAGAKAEQRLPCAGSAYDEPMHNHNIHTALQLVLRCCASQPSKDEDRISAFFTQSHRTRREAHFTSLLAPRRPWILSAVPARTARDKQCSGNRVRRRRAHGLARTQPPLSVPVRMMQRGAEAALTTFTLIALSISGGSMVDTIQTPKSKAEEGEGREDCFFVFCLAFPPRGRRG